ncbi:ComF family protein [Luteococcus peritonei]|uniref:ComF family protein n=1 Tax=Luteococcus peritonei TaxID=88874 RepID=A0ABW4RTI3_9ACTN
MLLDDLADLLLGARCPGCARPGLLLCPDCRAGLADRPLRVEDAGALPAGLECWSAGVHEGALREMVSAHKDRGSWLLAGVLGAQLAVAASPLLPRDGAVVLVPLPSSPRAVRERGYDHARALARAASVRLPGRPRVLPALRRGTSVADQAGLGRGQRAANQRGSMTARPVRPPGRAILVDDVCTTGASLAEARRSLLAAGWEVLGAAVVAQRTKSLHISPRTPEIRSEQR